MSDAKQPITFRAGKGRPCPACVSGSKGCSATADGLHLCRGEPDAEWREVSRGEDAAGFRHFRRADDATRSPGPNVTFGGATAGKDWGADAGRYAAALTADGRAELAAALVLPVVALDALPLLGWKADEGCWTLPECDGTAAAVGLTRRYRNGRKMAVKGGHRGLTLPAGWADRPGPLFVVEGPTDALAMTHAGLACVGRPSNSGGAEQLAVLVGDFAAARQVVVVGENDEKADGQFPGRDGARAVAASLAAALGRSVPVALPPPGAKDVRAWLTTAATSAAWADRGAELSLYLLAAAEPVDPPPGAAPDWPEPPGGEMFHGLLGDVVGALDPHTEADPLAIACQALVAFGNRVGRSAHCKVEATAHHANEFLVLVGRSAKARKGTSWGHVAALFRKADERNGLVARVGSWSDDRVLTGLSSGEGLIWAVRDPIEKQERVKDRGEAPRYETVVADEGVADKRALVQEPEFASVLKVIERQGNTLSPVIRQAWESGSVSTLTKNSPARTTGAHVSVIGHITAEELTRYLTATEAANGTGNRFLWVAVRRSKLLPEGGRASDAVVAALAERLAEAVAFAETAGEVPRDAAARRLWHGLYPVLSRERGGLAGNLLGRAEAHTLRLSLLYALLDRSATIRAEHLMAAVALWDYCERSVLHVFGDRTGDPLADELRDLLKAAPNGRTRTELMTALGKHQYGDRLSQALLTLERGGQARRESVVTGGRPAERWFAVTPKAAVSRLLATARGLFRECGESGRRGEGERPGGALAASTAFAAPRPDADPPPFDRFDRFDRTSGDAASANGTSPEAASPPVPDGPPWEDVTAFEPVMTATGWKWPDVLAWLAAEHRAKLSKGGGFLEVTAAYRRLAYEHLLTKPAKPEPRKGGRR